MRDVGDLLSIEMRSISYLLLFIFTVVILPWALAYFYWASVGSKTIDCGDFKLGLENISDDFLRTLGKEYFSAALITNHASKDQLGNRNIDLLVARKVNIKKIITPQHGFWGDVATGVAVKQITDSVTKIPIINLHDRNLEAADLSDIDVLFFDLQDVGIKHYSYVYTLLQAMELSADLKKILVILDRPNLLGSCIEGISTQLADGINVLSVPMRYGMTIGELALYYHKQLFGKRGALRVVPMANYHRQLICYKPIIGQLSPNIASVEACRGYSFLGILGEIAPFDIGVGTKNAFQCILLSEHLGFAKSKWYALRSVLNGLGVDGSYYRYYSSRKKCYYSGLRLTVRDINNFSFIKVLVTMLDFFKHEGLKISFSQRFEKIPGMIRVKDLIDGVISQADFDKELRCSLESFFAMAIGSFIYYPLPKMVA